MTGNPSDSFPDSDIDGSARPGILVRSRVARGFAHLGAALLAAVIVFSVIGKVLNDRYFSYPLLTFVCFDGRQNESDVLLTDVEMDEICGDTKIPTTTAPPYTDTEAVAVARTVRALWPDMSVRLAAEGYQRVKPNWLDQFDDADVAYLIHNACADAPSKGTTRKNRV